MGAGSVFFGVAAQPEFNGVPVAIWAAIFTFIGGNLVALFYRIDDRRRALRDHRIDLVSEILDSCREIVMQHQGESLAWRDRSNAEARAEKALLKLSRIGRKEDNPVIQWIRQMMEAVQYEDVWQDPNIFRPAVQMPMIQWASDRSNVGWFKLQLERGNIQPTPFEAEEFQNSAGILGRIGKAWLVFWG